MYDIDVPMVSYEREIAKIRKNLQQMGENYDPDEAKREREQEMNLIHEQEQQQEHVNRVMLRLNSEKDEWFLAST